MTTHKMDRDAVCVLLPAYEEGETVGDVVCGFQDAGYRNVLVIDGGSSDDTRAVAREAGARVEVQSGSGKGQAVREGVERYVEAEYVLLADADATYQPEDADRMVQPLLDDEAEHVIGDRYGDIHEDAMTRFNHVGNGLFNWLFRTIHGEEYRDILSGYRAFTTESFRRLRLRADGFGIETEMAVECARRDQRVVVVPITYLPRPDGSSSNLHPVKDGWIILAALYRRARTSNPLFYFGSVGLVMGATGIGIEAFVAYDWFVNRISHNVLAVSGGILLVLAVQFAVFGVLSDLVVTLHQETLDRVEAVESAVDRRSDSRGPRQGDDEPGADTVAPDTDPVEPDAPADTQHTRVGDDGDAADPTDGSPVTDGKGVADGEPTPDGENVPDGSTDSSD